MRLRARKDYENFSGDPDEGNYWEYLPLWYRFRHWDGWINARRAIKYRSLMELRWYRYRWYARNARKRENNAQAR